MDYTLQKMTPAEFMDSLFDHDPKVIALAETYQHRLFDNAEGRDILRRSKEFSEHYVRYIHATAHGVRGVGDPKAKMLDFTPAQSGPKKKLETDIDELLDRRLNQLNTSGIPEKYLRTLKIEITPAGEAYVKPYKLQPQMVQRLTSVD
jgi:hypothetical protein